MTKKKGPSKESGEVMGAAWFISYLSVEKYPGKED